MTHDHIVKSFDQELGRLDHIIAEMGGLAEAQLARAVAALIARDADAASRVVAADHRIDALEAEAESRVIRLLALRQPMAEDLRVVITALKVSGNLERIGDYAKNVAKRAGTLTQAAPMNAPVQSLARMGRMVQGMIKNVLDAYVGRDAALAADVRARDAEVDQLHNSLFRELLTYMMEDPRQITACTHLLFIAKNIERIGDHATNIAETVLFMVRGATPQEGRAKADRTSLTMIAPAAGDAGGGETK